MKKEHDKAKLEIAKKKKVDKAKMEEKRKNLE